MANAAQVATNQAGTRFGWPNITRPITVRENNDGLVTTLSTGSSVDTVGIIPLKQTDVITHWDAKFQFANAYSAGGTTATTSKYFPYNLIGQVSLNMQNQVNTVDWKSGIDGAIFNAIRPVRTRYFPDALLTNYASMYNAQGNLQSASNYTISSTTPTFRLQIPAGIWFDRFYVLNAQGTTTAIAPGTFVSPQYMAGTARIVQPTITYNQLNGGALDTSPFNFNGGTPTLTSTSTLNLLRNGYYQPTQPDGSDAPIVYNWQYVQRTKKQSLSGVSSTDLQFPVNGQILAVYVRLWDPAANGGLGAPITINDTNVPVVRIEYGSGLYRFQGKASDAQYQFLQQHPTLLPEGVIAFDFAYNEQGMITNQFALNTLNTSGVQMHIDFGSTCSSSAYAMIGVEALQLVTLGA